MTACPQRARGAWCSWPLSTNQVKPCSACEVWKTGLGEANTAQVKKGLCRWEGFRSRARCCRKAQQNGLQRRALNVTVSSFMVFPKVSNVCFSEELSPTLPASQMHEQPAPWPSSSPPSWALLFWRRAFCRLPFYIRVFMYVLSCSMSSCFIRLESLIFCITVSLPPRTVPVSC